MLFLLPSPVWGEGWEKYSQTKPCLNVPNCVRSIVTNWTDRTRDPIIKRLVESYKIHDAKTTLTVSNRWSFVIEFKRQTNKDAFVSWPARSQVGAGIVTISRNQLGERQEHLGHIHETPHMRTARNWKKQIYCGLEPTQSDWLRIVSACFRHLATIIMRKIRALM